MTSISFLCDDIVLFNFEALSFSDNVRAGLGREFKPVHTFDELFWTRYYVALKIALQPILDNFPRQG